MARKTEALRESYALFSRGNIQGAASRWTDDFVWDGGPSDFPWSGRHEGKQAALDVLEQTVGAYDEYALTADEFIEEADTVVVLGHSDVSKGGIAERHEVVHVWRFRGEQSRSLQIFADTLQAARLMGLLHADSLR